MNKHEMKQNLYLHCASELSASGFDELAQFAGFEVSEMSEAECNRLLRAAKEVTERLLVLSGRAS